MKHCTFFKIVLAATMLCGCNNEKDFFDSLNEIPQIKIGNSSEKVILDTVKISLKTGNSAYTFDVNFSDANKNIDRIELQILEGKGLFSIDGSPFSTTNSFLPLSEKSEIKYKPEYLGNNKIKIIVVDKWNRSDEVLLNLFVFQNIAPDASIRYFYTRSYSPYEFNLDASESKDGDANFGGNISLYQWMIDSKTITNDASVTPWVFEGPGTYELKLQVQDNDGVWSKEVRTLITVQ